MAACYLDMRRCTEEGDVAEEPFGERLAVKRQVTLLLRLVLEANDALVYGEVVDLEGRPHGRFSKWTELPSLVGHAVTG